MQAFKTSEDTGKLIGAARVLRYPSRPTPLIELPRTVTDRSSEKRPPPKVAQLRLEQRGDLLHFVDHPKWHPIPARYGTRTVLHVGKAERQPAVYAFIACDCGAQSRMVVGQWRKAEHKRCGKCAKEALKREFTGPEAPSSVQARVHRDGVLAMRSVWNKRKADVVPYPDERKARHR